MAKTEGLSHILMGDDTATRDYDTARLEYVKAELLKRLSEVEASSTARPIEAFSESKSTDDRIAGFQRNTGLPVEIGEFVNRLSGIPHDNAFDVARKIIENLEDIDYTNLTKEWEAQSLAAVLYACLQGNKKIPDDQMDLIKEATAKFIAGDPAEGLQAQLREMGEGLSTRNRKRVFVVLGTALRLNNTPDEEASLNNTRRFTLASEAIKARNTSGASLMDSIERSGSLLVAAMKRMNKGEPVKFVWE